MFETVSLISVEITKQARLATLHLLSAVGFRAQTQVLRVRPIYPASQLHGPGHNLYRQSPFKAW